MPSSHLILYRPLLLLPPIPPSFRDFSNESTLPMRWPKYWSFSFSIIPSKEHPELISFRMDWLDLLAVQGTHKSLLQYHSSKALILWRSAFFTVQLSHPCMTTEKTIALTRRTWMASPTRWTWVWVNSGSWWWTGRPGMLWFMGSQRVRHNWVTELNFSYGKVYHMIMTWPRIAGNFVLGYLWIWFLFLQVDSFFQLLMLSLPTH